MLFTIQESPEAQHSPSIQSYLSLQSLTSDHRMKAGGLQGGHSAEGPRVIISE